MDPQDHAAGTGMAQPDMGQLCHYSSQLNGMSVIGPRSPASLSVHSPFGFSLRSSQQASLPWRQWERQARDTREAAERREIDAQVKAIEAEQKAEKKQEQAERLERERARNPVAWGWGAGPGYWPRYGRRLP